MLKFPLLTADDIEVKVKQISEKGAVALLYKTARTDMDLLDKTVGAENWESHYEEIHSNLFCTISIYCDGRKVSKQDCGIESREDGEGNEKKGEASDAFKRAGFKWGIGRELYTSPFIFLKVETAKNGNYWNLKDKYQKFAVSQIGYDDNRHINQLTIVDVKTGEVVYQYGTNTVKTASKAPARREAPTTQTKVVTGSTVPPMPIKDAKSAEDAYKAFLSRHGITPTEFTEWRKKAMAEYPNDIPQKPFKEMSPEDWDKLLMKLEKLSAEGYFHG